jgi:hypothetical protein
MRLSQKRNQEKISFGTRGKTHQDMLGAIGTRYAAASANNLYRKEIQSNGSAQRITVDL